MQEVVSNGDAFMEVVTVANDDIILLLEQFEISSTLLLRITDQLDIILAVGIMVIVVGVFYTILKGFTRF